MFGRLRFSKPVCGSAHDERACGKAGGGCGGSDELCEGTGGRGELELARVGAFELRRSSVVALRCADGRGGISPLDVRWWCARRGLDSERGTDGARADADEPLAWDMRFTRSVLPVAGRFCRPSVGEELCERCGECVRLLLCPGDRGPYCCIMNGGEGGRRGMSMPMPYICGICMGIAIGIADMGMGIGIGMVGLMFIGQTDGKGGTGTC